MKPLMQNLEHDLALLKRGSAEIITEENLREKMLRAHREGKPLKIKLGLDPTAPHIHLGFAVVLRKLRQFQDMGHQVYMLIGDFTALVGDPSGRSETRKVLAPEEIEQNAATYKEQFDKILDPEKTNVVFNSQWLSPMTFMDVINLASRSTVARLLERDDFQNRYRQGKPIGVHEILYPLMQAYDSVALEADVELGGTDQKFNILIGREIQKEFGQEPQVVFLMPILEGLDGIQKMSKSLGNYVGITEPPSEMFGKIMSIPDYLILKYFELCTDIPLQEIEEIKTGMSIGRIHPMNAKKKLALEIITLYHGGDAAFLAKKEFEKVFQEKEMPSQMEEVEIHRADLKEERIWIIKLLVLSGLAESNREARRLIAQGAVDVDGQRIDSPDRDLEIGEGTVLKVGSRKFVRIKIAC